MKAEKEYMEIVYFLKNSGGVFTLKVDNSKMTTDCDFYVINSPDAKTLSIFRMK